MSRRVVESTLIAEGFDTEIEDCGDELAGPWREPKQMLSAQQYDSHASIHDDETAKRLGFQGGTIEGPTHFSQFEPLGTCLWGRAWFETGCISAHYRAPVFAGEQVRAFVTKPAPGAKQTTIAMRKRDGTEVLAGTMSVNNGASRAPTALEARIATLSALRDPVILRDVKVGMTTRRVAVAMRHDQHLGAYYPFSENDGVQGGYPRSRRDDVAERSEPQRIVCGVRSRTSGSLWRRIPLSRSDERNGNAR